MIIDLNIIWFILVGILFTGYVILDGFDLGIGIIYLFVKSDEDRRILLNAIGPVWDGNEVWLVTAGGALFAAFPEVYASVFSGFYIAFILLLFALIFRATAIEFRSKLSSSHWRSVWDVSFSLSSLLASILIGVIFGNIVRGIPLNEQFNFIGSFWSLINPYSILLAITTVALFTMHGIIYGVLKTEGKLNMQLKNLINNAIIVFVICYVTLTMVTLVYIPHITKNFVQFPLLFCVPILGMLSIANIPREIHHGREWRAFLSSSASIIWLMALFGIGNYPNMVFSITNPDNSLTIYNAASSQATLKTILIIAFIGMPLVLVYTISIYWIFRGKVKLDSKSY